MTAQQPKERVRIDRWLWAARFFKTRSQAASAIDRGHVDINGDRTKRSKTVVIGDIVHVRKGPYQFELEVRELSERRGPAPEAQKLYQETQESQDTRQQIADARALERAFAPTPIIKGRPTKKDRRALAKFKRKHDSDE